LLAADGIEIAAAVLGPAPTSQAATRRWPGRSAGLIWMKNA